MADLHTDLWSINNLVMHSRSRGEAEQKLDAMHGISMSRHAALLAFNDAAEKRFAPKAAQASYRSQVEAKYIVVEAGWKDLLKKAGALIAGGMLLSQTALGLTFSKANLDKYEKSMKDTMKAYSMQADAAYDFKVDVKNMGGLQNVLFKVLKDGKVAGQVNFIGTENDTFNSYKVVMTSEGKSDPMVSHVMEIQQDGLNKMIRK